MGRASGSVQAVPREVPVRASGGSSTKGELPEGDDVFVDVSGGALVDSTGALGVSLVRKYILAFEIIGLLLVAALVGGLLLMRDPPEENEPESETGGASV